MRVTHVAGYRPMIDTIIEHQKPRGINPREIATREMNYTETITLEALSLILDGEAGTCDIIHLHDPAPLLNIKSHGSAEKIKIILEKIQKSGSKLVISMDGDVIAPGDIDAASLDTITELLRDYVSCVFIGSAEWSEVINRLDNWSWLPNPIDLNRVPAPQTYEPSKDKTRILHLSFSHALDDSKRIIEKLKALCAEDSRFVLTVSPVKDFSSIDQLRDTLRSHDVIVERISRPMYGWAALEGMAHGKTVLSGIHPQHRQEWQQLEFSPVLDSREDNLIERLKSLAHEPRSMRDIGKRSRSFVETYHSAEQVVAMMIEIYGTL